MCAVLGMLSVLSVPSAAARAETVVSLTFDDGSVSQLFARDQILAHRMRGTFYINSGRVASNDYYMTWDEIASVAAAGNEIGGHTLRDTALTDLPGPQRKPAICDDRRNLMQHGYDPVSFAYPHGQYNAQIQGYVRDCGYATARRVGGLSHDGCGSCRDAESIPPGDAYALRSNIFPSGRLTLAQMQEYVTQAEDAGGGWVPMMFHDVCDDCPDGALDGSISTGDFVALLDWLDRRRSRGTVVKTVRAVMGYADAPLPPLPVDEEPVPVHAFQPPVPAAVALASVKIPTRQKLRNLRVRARLSQSGTLSARGTVTLGKRYRLKRAKVVAAPGQTVTLRLSLTAKGLRAVKRALRRHRRVQAVITVVVIGPAGQVDKSTHTVTLR
jgi:peptidoglycan/xylan/chitin deacetylase (PgdA/CDA1 family)